MNFALLAIVIKFILSYLLKKKRTIVFRSFKINVNNILYNNK